MCTLAKQINITHKKFNLIVCNRNATKIILNQTSFRVFVKMTKTKGFRNPKT